MRKRVLPFLLVVCVFVSLLSTETSAAGDSIRYIVQAYKQVINQTSFYKYADSNAVSLCDLDGDTIPEMFLCTAKDGATAVETQLWTTRIPMKAEALPSRKRSALRSSMKKTEIRSTGTVIGYHVR